MLEATTGFKLSSDGRILNPDLHGNGVDNFIADLASDRLYGDLQGPVTPTSFVSDMQPPGPNRNQRRVASRKERGLAK